MILCFLWVNVHNLQNYYLANKELERERGREREQEREKETESESKCEREREYKLNLHVIRCDFLTSHSSASSSRHVA